MLLELPDRAWEQVLSGLDPRDTLTLEHVSPGIRQRQQQLPKALTCRLCLAQTQYIRRLRQHKSDLEEAVQSFVSDRMCRNDYLSVRRVMGSVHNLEQRLARRCSKLFKRYSPLLSPALKFAIHELLRKQDESAKARAATAMKSLQDLCSMVEA